MSAKNSENVYNTALLKLCAKCWRSFFSVTRCMIPSASPSEPITDRHAESHYHKRHNLIDMRLSPISGQTHKMSEQSDDLENANFANLTNFWKFVNYKWPKLVMFHWKVTPNQRIFTSFFLNFVKIAIFLRILRQRILDLCSQPAFRAVRDSLAPRKPLWSSSKTWSPRYVKITRKFLP